MTSVSTPKFSTGVTRIVSACILDITFGYSEIYNQSLAKVSNFMFANMCENVEIGMYVFLILAHSTPWLTLRQSVLCIYTGQWACKAPDFNMGWYGQVPT